MMRRVPLLKLSTLILLLLASAACEVDFVPRAEAREEWKKTYAVEAGGELRIENTNGKIVVRPGSGSEVEVVATRIAKAGSDEAAKKLLAEMKMEESATGSAIRISSKQSRMNWGSTQYRVDYEVHAPVGITLALSATNGTIDVSDWEGRVEMSATNGTLDGHGLKGEVEAETTNGKIDINLATLSEDGVKLETTNGELVLQLPRDSKGKLSARVTNGGISVDGLNAEPSPANTRRRYEAALNGGGPASITLETTNGAIRVSGNQ